MCFEDLAQSLKMVGGGGAQKCLLLSLNEATHNFHSLEKIMNGEKYDSLTQSRKRLAPV